MRIEIENDQYDALRAVAASEGTTPEVLIRQAINELVVFSPEQDWE